MPAEMPAPEGIPVPLSSLGQPDDKEKMQTPVEGDSVSLQVDATIVSIQGDTAFIKPTAVNGNLIDEEAGEPPVADDGVANPDEAEASLRDAMSQEQPQ